jgi:hypothetical protein
MVELRDVSEKSHVLEILQMKIPHQAVDESAPEGGVTPHDPPFLGGKGASFQENSVGDAELAHVVHGGEEFHGLNLLIVEA